MNTLSSEDGDASERELLVDDIQRIRQVLHISAGSSNKLCSDEEEEEDSDEEDEEDDEPGENEESSLIGVLWMVLKAFLETRLNWAPLVTAVVIHENMTPRRIPPSHNADVPLAFN